MSGSLMVKMIESLFSESHMLGRFEILQWTFFTLAVITGKVTEEKQNYISELSPVSKGCKK